MDRLENLIKKCDECKLHECIGCEIVYNDIQAIKRLLFGIKEIKEKAEIEAFYGLGNVIDDINKLLGDE